MRVVFLYNCSTEDPGNAAEDEFPEQSPVVAAINRLDHQVIPLCCTLDLEQVRQQLLRIDPDLVFNRVESLGGSDSMMAAITLLLDSLGIPYTGNSSEALVGTASKTSLKQRLIRFALPTPRWFDRNGAGGCATNDRTTREFDVRTKYIIKPDLEHASFAIDDRAIVEVSSRNDLVDLIRDREELSGRPYFAEEFIVGREFNISALGEPPRVLPVAEIDFTAFPKGKPRIVSRDAKWNTESFEFNNTPRRFEFPDSDSSLIEQLHDLTLACWRLFQLTGYARVDFRVDVHGRPWILEINTNPCISPDAGFAAAMDQAGLSYEAGLQQIIDCAMTRCSKSNNQRQARGTANIIQRMCNSLSKTAAHGPVDANFSVQRLRLRPRYRSLNH